MPLCAPGARAATTRRRARCCAAASGPLGRSCLLARLGRSSLLRRACLVLVAGGWCDSRFGRIGHRLHRLAIPWPQRGPRGRQLARHPCGVGVGSGLHRTAGAGFTGCARCRRRPCAGAAATPHVAHREQALAARPGQRLPSHAGAPRRLRRATAACCRGLRGLALALCGRHLLCQGPGAGDALHNRDGDGVSRPAGRWGTRQHLAGGGRQPSLCMGRVLLAASKARRSPPCSKRALTSAPPARRAGCPAAGCPCAPPPAVPGA